MRYVVVMPVIAARLGSASLAGSRVFSQHAPRMPVPSFPGDTDVPENRR